MLVSLAGITLAGAGSKQAALQRIAAAVQAWQPATCATCARSNAPQVYDSSCRAAGWGRQLAGGGCHEAGRPGAPASEAAEVGRPWPSWLPSPSRGMTDVAADVARYRSIFQEHFIG